MVFQPIPLYPFQAKCARRMVEWSYQGRRRSIGESPTGSGKGRMGMAVIRALQRSEMRAIYITKGIDLVQETYKNFLEFYDEEDLGLVWASTKQYDRWITIASIDTLTSGNVMEEILSLYGPYDIVIFDECQYSLAPKYKKVVEKLLARDGFLGGLSGTPYRADGKNLSIVFPDGISFSQDYFRLIAEGYLASVESHDIPTNLDLKSLVVEGEYTDVEKVPPDVLKQLEASNRYEQFYQGWLEYAPGKRTLIFAQSLQDAWNFQKFLEGKGYECPVVTGDTHGNTRDDIKRRIKSGELTFAVNFGVWTTGLDIPELECIVNGRLITFRGLFLQIVGRGTRICKWIGKTKCIFLNLTDRHFVLCTMGECIGRHMTDIEDVQRILLEKTEEQLIEEGLTKEQRREYTISMAIDYLQTRSYNLLTGDGWVGDPETGRYTKDCGKKAGKLIAERSFLDYEIKHIYPSGVSRRVTTEPVPLQEALAKGAAYLERLRERESMDNGTSARLKLPITAKQLEHLHNQRVPHPKDGVAPDGTQMTQADYIAMKKHLEEYGSNFTVEGGSTGFIQDKFTGKWGRRTWPYNPAYKGKKSAKKKAGEQTAQKTA